MKKMFFMMICCGCAFMGALQAFGEPLQKLPPTEVLELKPSTGEFPSKINPGESLKFALNVPESSCPTHSYLRVFGLVDGCGGGNAAFNKRNFVLNDVAEKNADGSYHLMIRGWGRPFAQAVYVHARAGLKGGVPLKLKFNVSGKGLKLLEGGKLGATVEYYLKSDKYAAGKVDREPDQSFFIEFPAGDYEWRDIEKELNVPENIDSILFTIGGYNFDGVLCVKQPEASQGGKDIGLPAIEPNSRRWIGGNVSRLAWPEFSFLLDGKPFFSGPVFQKATNNNSDFEIDLPEMKAGGHELEIRLDRTWGPDKGYTFASVEFLREKARAFELVGAPRFVPEGSDFAVLVETNKKNVKLRVSSSDGAKALKEEVLFDEPGLHAVRFKAGKAGSSPELTFSSGKRTDSLRVIMVTAGASDKIYVSTSDWIYAGHFMFRKYMNWMYANGIINSIVIRPSYMWGGSRTREKSFFLRFKKLCDDLHLTYSLMVEGRTLPGARINPKDEWLAGDNYLGRQSHEDDGSYYYWGGGGRPYPNGLMGALMCRFLDGGGIYPKFFPDTSPASGMREGCERFVANIKRAKHSSTRHTGPSVLFRYFYQVGYDWLGAEQFYGPEEIIMSALRGASRAYGKSRYGTHHATQWGARGYGRQSHADAQFKSHAVAYMHGSTHINTEDALWNTENGEYRFSDAALRHVDRQREFMDYVLTHRRRGRMVTPVAIVHGRYDGWTSFGHRAIWLQRGGQWKAGDAEASYELLKVFYPRRRMRGFSVGGTPYGAIDILPIEAPQEVLNSYQTLIFLGWNTYDEAEFERLLKYVKQGGVVVMTKAHLNTNLQHNGPIDLPAKSAFWDAIKSKLGDAGDTVPSSIDIGEGRVVIFNTDKYPGNKDLKDAYAEVMRKAGERMIATERAKGWIRANDKVEFAVWDSSEGGLAMRKIYLLNVGGGLEKVSLLLGKSTFEIPIKPVMINMLYITDGLAVQASDPLARVLKIKRQGKTARITVQAVAPCGFTVYDGRSGKRSKVKVAVKGESTVGVDF